jgi:hypothetical protein
MVTEIKLGLCNPPEPIYLYINQGEVDGESYVWYKFNINQDKKIPVSQRALTGYLSELRLTTKEFKGKDNLKLDIVVSADELYVIRTGVETNFAKSFLLAASLVQDFSKPLINEPSMGYEPVIASLSLGGVRKFQIKPRNGKPTDFWLEHGSLLVMHPGCQSTHLHQVPKTNKVVSTRINLTFRPHTGGGR